MDFENLNEEERFIYFSSELMPELSNKIDGYLNDVYNNDINQDRYEELLEYFEEIICFMTDEHIKTFSDQYINIDLRQGKISSSLDDNFEEIDPLYGDLMRIIRKYQ